MNGDLLYLYDSITFDFIFLIATANSWSFVELNLVCLTLNCKNSQVKLAWK